MDKHFASTPVDSDHCCSYGNSNGLSHVEFYIKSTISSQNVTRQMLQQEVSTGDCPGDPPAQPSRAHPPRAQQLWDAKCFWTLTPKIHLLTTRKCENVNPEESERQEHDDSTSQTMPFFSKTKHIGTPPQPLHSTLRFQINSVCLQPLLASQKSRVYARQGWGRREKSPEERYYTLGKKMINARPR